MVLKFRLVFPGRQVEKRMFPIRKPTAYTLPPHLVRIGLIVENWQQLVIQDGGRHLELC